MSSKQSIYFYNRKNQDQWEIPESLITLGRNHNFKKVQDSKDANIIVSIGEDGDFLQAVRKSNFRSDCLYAGISASGNLNMYCDFSIDDHNKMISAITESRLEVRKYPVIEVSIDDQPPFYCLNELSIRSSIIKTFVIDVFIDHLHFETFSGDGLVISTPTGSTGYNKSVNGAVVDPSLPCYQVSELASLNNNSYRTLGSSFVLSTRRKLTLRINDPRNSYPIIGLDNEAFNSHHIEKIEIKLSKKVIKTVKLKDNSYWEKVKRTFL